MIPANELLNAVEQERLVLDPRPDVIVESKIRADIDHKVFSQ